MKRLILLTVLALLPTVSIADDNWGSGGIYIDDTHLGDFLEGKNWERTQKDKEPPKKSTQAQDEKAPKQKQKLTLDWLRENYEIYDRRAQQDPTKENLEAVMYLKRVMFDKAQTYSNRYLEVQRENPLVDENSRIPTASLGGLRTSQVNGRAVNEAVKEMSKQGGLWVFVDSECRFCGEIMNTLRLLKGDHKTEILVISLDGKKPPGYTEKIGKFVTDNGMFQQLKLNLTPSVVYVHNPDATKPLDKHSFLIVSQGFQTADGLEKTMAYAAFTMQKDPANKAFANLLNPQIMAGLDAWNFGVMENTDLHNIEIDPNDPASIKKAIEPYLAKVMRAKGNKNEH